jgi:hypothetical protein
MVVKGQIPAGDPEIPLTRFHTHKLCTFSQLSITIFNGQKNPNRPSKSSYVIISFPVYYQIMLKEYIDRLSKNLSIMILPLL